MMQKIIVLTLCLVPLWVAPVDVNKKYYKLTPAEQSYFGSWVTLPDGTQAYAATTKQQAATAARSMALAGLITGLLVYGGQHTFSDIIIGLASSLSANYLVSHYLLKDDNIVLQEVSSLAGSLWGALIGAFLQAMVVID
jgi:hypothetical protein